MDICGQCFVGSKDKQASLISLGAVGLASERSACHAPSVCASVCSPAHSVCVNMELLVKVTRGGPAVLGIPGRWVQASLWVPASEDMLVPYVMQGTLPVCVFLVHELIMGYLEYLM